MSDRIESVIFFAIFAFILALPELRAAEQIQPAAPRAGDKFFNGKDLTGWSGNDGFWSIKDGAIIGHSDQNVAKNEFIWSDVEVRDFYLVLDVKLTPGNRNAGIQFRSRPMNKYGLALGYQADVGAGVWGKLYHEHGRGKLDWNNNAAGAVKHGDWNRYEILAMGHRIWTALNGKLCVAIDDSRGELTGRIAFQIHSGPPQTVSYRIIKLDHNPKIELDGLNEKQLLEALPKKVEVVESTPQPKPGWTPEVTAWRAKVDANDPGMNGKWFAAFDDTKWKTMNLPRHYEGAGLPGYDGTVWFRTTVEIPAAQAGKDLTLALGPIDDMDMTWFNGVQVGGIERPGFWAKPRVYTVPSKLVKAGRNVIAVRVLDHGWSGGFAGRAAQMKLSAPGHKPIALAGEWRYRPGVTLKSLGLGPFTNPAPPKPVPVPPPASALVRPLVRPAKPLPPTNGRFTIQRDMTVIILGGTNAFECDRHGFLESLLVAAHPKRRVRLRNMAWQADTVYQQQRPRNFYTNPNADPRKKIAADMAILWMGQSEAIEAPVGVEAFVQAYTMQLEVLLQYTSQMVLVTPVPAEDPLKIGIDIAKRNASLAGHTNAIKRIGEQKKLPVVDLFSAFQARGVSEPLTRNGIHLSLHGHWLAAKVFADSLGYSSRVEGIRLSEADWALQPSAAEALRQAVLRKNKIWFQYWRPTNWAFLFGNRQQVPSSRDHRNHTIRWFPQEVEAILLQIRKTEDAIYRGIKKWRKEND